MFLWYVAIVFLATTDAFYFYGPKESWTPKLFLANETCNYGEGEIVILGLVNEQNLFRPQITVCRDPFNPVKIFWNKHSPSKTYGCDDDSQESFHWLWKTFREVALTIYDVLIEEVDFAYLVPECDFASKIEREVVKSKNNVVLMDKVLHRGNWKEMEELVRSTVNEGIDVGPVIVITGSFGWTTKFRSNVADYYAKYLFKIVRTANELKIYVAANGEEETDEDVCEVTEEECDFPDYEKGRIYCCQLDADLLLRMGLEVENLLF